MLPKLENLESPILLNQEVAGGYFLFAHLFQRAPEKDFLERIIRSQLLTQARHFYNQDVECFDKSLEDPQWLNKEEEIAVEFASLFVAAGQQMIIPYESYYCDTLTIDHSTACSAYFQAERGSVGLKGFLGGASSRSVDQCYKNFGFEINPLSFDLPDHVSMELEFVGKLYERNCCEEAQSFYREHLGRWIHLFLNKLLVQTKSDFYRTVAESLKCFLSMYDRGRDERCLDWECQS